MLPSAGIKGRGAGWEFVEYFGPSHASFLDHRCITQQVCKGMTDHPGFEGFEKRLEIEFLPNLNSLRAKISNFQGLCALAREDTDRFLKDAECTIVSHLSNEHLDSYVLSESSLFIYPLRIVIKTCGTTQLLRAIPSILESASRLLLTVRRCRYSRGTFIFPSAQPYPHNSFSEEVAYLERFFGDLGSGGEHFVMGDEASAQNWHVYHAAVETDLEECYNNSEEQPMYTLEMCMTQLSREAAWHFCKSAHGSAAEMTEASGISQILPGSEICDFAFDPCGYSMNGIESAAYSTIHITPEPGFSYASFEVMGYCPGSGTDLRELVDRVASIFKPGQFSLALSVAGWTPTEVRDGRASLDACPEGYCCDVLRMAKSHDSSSVVNFHTFKRLHHGETQGRHVEMENSVALSVRSC